MIASDNFDSMRKNKGGYIVKLFGKKTLAMILSIAMVLSVCSMSVFAGGAITLTVGGTQDVSVTLAEGESVSWSASDGDVTVAAGENGAATITGAAAGDATVTATITSSVEGAQPRTETWNVTVTVPASGVTMSQSTASIVIKGSVDLDATVAPDNATNKNVTWTSSDSNVATVSSSGVVTGVNVGTATITATAESNSEAKATCTVTVGKATVVSAVGTVGLTMGLTPSFTLASRIILMVLMFAGRLGGLTFILSLAEKRSHPLVERPSGKVLIG